MTARRYGLSACVLAIVLLLAAILSGAVKAAERPHIMNAWIKLPAVSSRPAAGYFMAHGTAAKDRLIGVTAPGVQRIELHSMTETDGVMKMRAETGFDLPAKGMLTFAPGGSHLMIFGLPASLKPGDKLPLTFSFQSGVTVTVDAVAQPANAPEPQHKH